MTTMAMGGTTIILKFTLRQGAYYIVFLKRAQILFLNLLKNNRFSNVITEMMSVIGRMQTSYTRHVVSEMCNLHLEYEMSYALHDAGKGQEILWIDYT